MVWVCGPFTASVVSDWVAKECSWQKAPLTFRNVGLIKMSWKALLLYIQGLVETILSFIWYLNMHYQSKNHLMQQQEPANTIQLCLGGQTRLCVIFHGISCYWFPSPIWQVQEHLLYASNGKAKTQNQRYKYTVTWTLSFHVVILRQQVWMRYILLE